MVVVSAVVDVEEVVDIEEVVELDVAFATVVVATVVVLSVVVRLTVDVERDVLDVVVVFALMVVVVEMVDDSFTVKLAARGGLGRMKRRAAKTIMAPTSRMPATSASLGPLPSIPSDIRD